MIYKLIATKAVGTCSPHIHRTLTGAAWWAEPCTAVPFFLIVTASAGRRSPACCHKGGWGGWWLLHMLHPEYGERILLMRSLQGFNMGKCAFILEMYCVFFFLYFTLS